MRLMDHLQDTVIRPCEAVLRVNEGGKTDLHRPLCHELQSHAVKSSTGHGLPVEAPAKSHVEQASTKTVLRNFRCDKTDLTFRGSRSHIL